MENWRGVSLKDDLRDQLNEVMDRYPGLRLKPGRSSCAQLEGEFAFEVTDGEFKSLQGNFLVKVSVPRTYPRSAPTVWELRGEIPSGVHVNPDGSLCLASPIDLDLALSKRPSLVDFLDRFLLAFLVGFLVYRKTGRFPWGERKHGVAGALQGIAEWLDCKPSKGIVVPCLRVFLPGHKPGNGENCPCGSGERYTICHEPRISELVREYGSQGMCEIAWRQLEILGFPGGFPKSRLRREQEEIILELLGRGRLMPTMAPNVHFGS